MKLSDNAEVQKLIADHTRLRAMWQKLGETNPNARHAYFATGYFKDSLTITDIDPFPTDAERSSRIALGIAVAAKELVNKELQAVEEQLGALGVNAAE
jgi:hypothetical protein